MAGNGAGDEWRRRWHSGVVGITASGHSRASCAARRPTGSARSPTGKSERLERRFIEKLAGVGGNQSNGTTVAPFGLGNEQKKEGGEKELTAAAHGGLW
jgi:hypothetical protein